MCSTAKQTVHKKFHKTCSFEVAVVFLFFFFLSQSGSCTGKDLQGNN